jgi:hypothetical protein
VEKASSKWPDNFVHVTYDPAKLDHETMLELIHLQGIEATVYQADCVSRPRLDCAFDDAACFRW